MSKDSKKINIKNFISHLDKTLEMFEDYVSDEEFERKDSDVYKLFSSLFQLYGEVSKREPLRGRKRYHYNIDMAELISKNKDKPQKLKWENYPINSDHVAQEVFREGLEEICSSDDGPIIFTEDKEIETKKAEEERKILRRKINQVREFKKDIENGIDDGGEMSASDTIKKKIEDLKKILKR